MPIPPIPDYPPQLAGIVAAYIAVIATILIGIFFTKDDKRNFENIVGNIVSFALLLEVVHFTWFTVMIMGVYLVIGIAIAIEKKRKYFWLFGSKCYGSLALMFLLVDGGFFGFEMVAIDFPITLIVFQYLAEIFIGWIILTSIAFTVGYLYWRKPSPKKTSSNGPEAASLKALFSDLVSKKGRSGKRSKRKSKRKSTSKGTTGKRGSGRRRTGSRPR